MNDTEFTTCGGCTRYRDFSVSAKLSARYCLRPRAAATTIGPLRIAVSGVPTRPGYRLLCCALWIDDGAIPKYLRNTRLKCDELEKPHENATSVIVFPPWVSSS
jgi:hypothetical protein